jgi:hypothetical protein
MTDQRQTNQIDDPPRPSQTEGERETVEQDLNQRDAKRQRPEGSQLAGDRTNDPPRPSQAEGERDSTDIADKKR